MASRKMERQSFHLQSGKMGLCFLFGSVQLAAGADTASVAGSGFASVAYDGAAGEYVVTLEDAWAGLVSAQLSFEHDGAVDAAVHMDSSDVAAKTLKIRWQEAGLAAQPSVDAKVHVMLALKN